MPTAEGPTREQVIRAIVDALEPLDFIIALWEGGAVAFGRLDRWSDIDIHVDALDDKVDEVFGIVEGALEKLAPIELKFEVPQPTWHGHLQAFYRLKGADPYMIIDLAVMKHSSANKFLEPEIHDNARFHFNKGDAVKVPRLDRKGFLSKVRDRLEFLRKRSDMFQCFVQKDIYRGHYAKALAHYHRLTLGLLLEALLIKYKTVHHDFGTYYMYFDLPSDIAERLQGLYFVRDPEDLQRKYEEAKEWFEEVMASIDMAEVERLLNGKSSSG